MATGIFVHPAIVTGTDPEYRTVDVRWLNLDGSVTNVAVVSDTGDFSLPKVDDIGLVIQFQTQAYYLGKMEYNYKAKIDGTCPHPDDPQDKLLAKLVADGEILISNLLQNVWLSINNAGDFSFLNGFSDGLRYFSYKRVVQLKSMLSKIMGNGVTAKFGTVFKDGIDLPIQEIPLFPSIEAVIELLFQKMPLARFHLGHIKNALGIDEFGTFGGRLRAVLETAQGLPGLPTVSASLKFDEIGNIEIASTLGKVSIDSIIPLGSILLGGMGALQKAVLGDLLLIWLNRHTHSTAVGPSSPPIVPAPPTLLSLKVMVSP